MQGKQHKTIVVMGLADSGKTMLINSLINYVFNVEWDNNFRFQLIQEHPATTRVTVYDIDRLDGFRIPFSLTIVDISGYGQVRNMSSNRSVNAEIRQQLMDGGADSIQDVDMVVFVAHASQPCPEVVLMLELVRSVFDGEVKKNVSYFFTSADSQVPHMLSAIKGSNLSCPVNAETGQPIYYNFNSSRLSLGGIGNPLPTDFTFQFVNFDLKQFLLPGLLAIQSFCYAIIA